VAEPIDLDEVVKEVLAAAHAARESGVYPPGLEEQLQSDFARQLHRPDPRDRVVRLRSMVEELSEHHLGRAPVPTSSSVPGGAVAHKVVSKAVGRQIDGVYTQLNDYAMQLVGVIRTVVDGLEDPKSHVHSEILYELDALQDRVAELQLTIDSLGQTYRQATGVMARLLDHLNSFDGVDARLAVLEEAERRRGFDPFFEYGRFEDVARGAETDIESEYADLADRLADAPGPVLDIGAGRGELLRLLIGRGKDCWGLEIDEDLVRDGVAAGLDIRLTDGLDGLRAQPFSSLGAVVLLHVIEHLTPNEQMELVSLAFDRLRPGGELIIETPNPQSLYVFARAFWLDPTHSKPVHPVYLEFVLRQAGFKEVLFDWTSLPAEDERLVLPEDADSPLAEVVAENARRVNDLVFAAQNYRAVARR
jgi:SAM-dependent methyltransferase